MDPLAVKLLDNRLFIKVLTLLLDFIVNILVKDSGDLKYDPLKTGNIKNGCFLLLVIVIFKRVTCFNSLSFYLALALHQVTLFQ